MHVLILGGVAAGTKTAAKLKRADRSLDVKILTKDADISYAGCGLPYYVGGLIGSREELIINTPAAYSSLTGVEVLTGREAVSVAPDAQDVYKRQAQTAAVKYSGSGDLFRILRSVTTTFSKILAFYFIVPM